MNENEIRTETVPLRIVMLVRAFLYAFYAGTTVFLIYCEFMVPGGADFGWPQQTIWQRLESVVFGPILFCWFFLFATAFPASVLIAIGEILMAGLRYYLLAGIVLATWIYWNLCGHLPVLFAVSRHQAPFEAYLVGAVTASVAFWRFASHRTRRMAGSVSE